MNTESTPAPEAPSAEARYDGPTLRASPLSQYRQWRVLDPDTRICQEVTQGEGVEAHRECDVVFKSHRTRNTAAATYAALWPFSSKPPNTFATEKGGSWYARLDYWQHAFCDLDHEGPSKWYCDLDHQKAFVGLVVTLTDARTGRPVMFAEFFSLWHGQEATHGCPRDLASSDSFTECVLWDIRKSLPENDEVFARKETLIRQFEGGVIHLARRNVGEVPSDELPILDEAPLQEVRKIRDTTRVREAMPQ